MNIEVITTKKKISKSVIRQLEPAGIASMNLFLSISGSRAYYVTDMGPKFPVRVGIFKDFFGNWVRFNASEWKESSCNKKRALMKGGNRLIDFESEKEMRDWVNTKNKMCKLALKNHLII